MKKLSKAKRRRRLKVLKMWGTAVVICIIMTVVFMLVKSAITQKSGTKSSRINYEQYVVPKPNVKKALLTVNKNSRPGIKLRKIKGIVIHYTANPGTDAMANRNYFESRKNLSDDMANKVSSHFIIGLDGTIIQCIPLNEISYASNNRNSDTISIECCHPDSSGKFSKKTYNSVIKLAGWLCAKYQIENSDIIRHYDVTGKLCPLYYVNNSDKWNRLRNQIKNYILKYRKE